MASPKELVRVEAALRDAGLSLPGTTEDFPWGHRALKVKKKAFAFIVLEGQELSISVKLPESSGAALSLPFVGGPIARRHGVDPEGCWGQHFAEPVGRGKARLLARYGLWVETPNPQNLLVQLDRQLFPTGKLVFRDVGDGDCATDAREVRDVPWRRLVSDLRPETSTSFS